MYQEYQDQIDELAATLRKLAREIDVEKYEGSQEEVYLYTAIRHLGDASNWLEKATKKAAEKRQAHEA